MTPPQAGSQKWACAQHNQEAALPPVSPYLALFKQPPEGKAHMMNGSTAPASSK